MKKMLTIAGLLIALAGAGGILWAASSNSGGKAAVAASGTEQTCPMEDCGQCLGCGGEQTCPIEGCGQGLCLRQGKGNCGGERGRGDCERRQDRKRDGSCGNSCGR
jgi:hypothetical protein